MRKIKKLVATLLAATMVMAMGVTAFAADSLADGKYTAKQNLYKNSACTTTSMGDALHSMICVQKLRLQMMRQHLLFILMRLHI